MLSSLRTMTQENTQSLRRLRLSLVGAFSLIALSLVPGCIALSGKPVQEEGDYCSEDRHCADGLECDGNRCRIVGACSNSSDCGTGQGCRRELGESHGECVDVECSEEDESACAPFTCKLSEGVCYRGCDYTGGCAPGYTCNGTTNDCVPAECDGYSTNRNGVCLTSCSDDSECSENNTCAPWGDCGVHEDCGNYQPAEAGGCRTDCEDNSECLNGATCTYRRVCVESAKADCGPYQRNSDGTCKVSCDLGSDCLDGFFCNGSCVKQCSNAADCGIGQGCNIDDYCAYECSSDSQCHPEQRCGTIFDLCQ